MTLNEDWTWVRPISSESIDIYLKCCHQYVSVVDGWQDTSDPKKVVLDMRSEHFVEALPLWRSIAETTVQRDVQGSILIQSVITLKLPKHLPIGTLNVKLLGVQDYRSGYN